MDLPVLRTHQSSRLLIAFPIPGIIIIITFLLLTIRYVSFSLSLRKGRKGWSEKKKRKNNTPIVVVAFFFSLRNF